MHVLSATRRLAARRPPALLSCRRSAFVGLDKPTDAASQEEVDHVALQLSRLLRALAIGWLGWKLYEIIVEGGNTYLIAPSLTLVRSRHADNRESGIWRVNNWHSSGAHRACNSLPSCNPLALLASNTVSTPVHVAAPALEVVLEQGGAARSVEITAEEEGMIKPLGLLTAKPIIYATNVSEDDLADGNAYCSEATALAEQEGAETVRISAQVEAELVELGDEERADYLEGLGVSEGGLRSLIRATYRLLGLRTYFTTGEKETRAWTFKSGMTAPQTAGVIHTDFERGFIRAQTIGCEKLLEAGSLVEARSKGWLRSEGKDYVVAEGDVMEFLFNV